MKNNGLSAGGVAKIFGVAALAATLAGCAEKDENFSTHIHATTSVYCEFDEVTMRAQMVDAKLNRTIVEMANGRIEAPSVISGTATAPAESKYPLSLLPSWNRFTVELDEDLCSVRTRDLFNREKVDLFFILDRLGPKF